MNTTELKAAHRFIVEYKYEPPKLDKGYSDKTLHIDISANKISTKQVTGMMKEKFVGGKGFGLWYLWNAVTPQTQWNDPENEIIIAPGPVAGITQYPGSGKSLVVTLSPLTGMPIDSNVGGYFGPLLKFSGWDALEIQGKADKDVIIVIDGNEGIVRIEEAPLEAVDGHVLGEQLTEMYAKSEEDRRNIAVVTAGTAAEHTLIGLLNFTFYDVRRKVARLKQAGRGGIGTVFRNKRIKALVVRFSGVKGNLNHPADISKINKAGIKLHKEICKFDNSQNRMRQIGTANIIEVMDQYDLLPTHNYKFGSHPDTHKIASKCIYREIHYPGNAGWLLVWLFNGLRQGCRQL